ncbi:hypothetical protein AgCh_010916 [Apium graveolens]
MSSPRGRRSWSEEYVRMEYISDYWPSFEASSVSSPIITQSGLHHRDTLDVLIRNGAWSLPTANSRSHHLDPLLLSWLENFEYPSLHSGPDLLLWNDIDIKRIKTWHIWDSIRFRAERVPWYQGVWHKLRVNRTPLAPYEKSKFLGSGGSMVARLKLKRIEGRAPPGVEPAV